MKSLLNLVGISHAKGASKIVPLLADGQPLTLIPKPDNPFDPNAIQVWLRLGYVKKEQAAQLSPLLLANDTRMWPAKIVTAHSGYAEMEIDDPPTPKSEPDNGSSVLGGEK